MIDAVITTAKILTEEMGIPSIMVPNGCDIDRFRKTVERPRS